MLNKHGVTRQLWLSSPVSGPRKFNYHADQQTWLGERDLTDKLADRLNKEWSQAFGKKFDFKF